MADGATQMKSDLGLYDYLPWPGRPKITWPGGKRIAVWIAPNIEFYEYNPPNNPTRTPWARPIPMCCNILIATMAIVQAGSA